MEEINEKELVRDVNSYITTVISQAKEIASRTDINQLSQTQRYDVDTAQTYIDTMTGQIDNARKGYEELKNMPNSLFWTIGRNKAKTEQTQKVVKYAIDAINNNALATKALFNNQILLANASKQLYALGVMGIASNRIVVREIRLRLKNASQEELDDLARKELENVVNELEKQKALEEKVDHITDVIGKRATPHSVATGIMKDLQKIDDDLQKHDDNLQKHDDDLQKHNDDLKKQNDKLKEIKNAISSTENNISQLFDKTTQLASTIEHNREEASNNVDTITNSLSDLSVEVEKKYKKIETDTTNHQKRLEQLEYKSFIDSTFYKVMVGLSAVVALVLSILNYFS